MILSPIAAEHVHSPRNAGELEDATHVGTGGTPGEGPYVRLWLILEEGTVRKATYACNGCPSSIAAASMSALLLAGRTVAQALSIDARDVMTVLGGLPEGKEYYADLAVQAIQDALKEELSERQL
ncbi:MAG: iron-sulfur cluster assembly scaffold protein [Fimbriimonadaceae bacterium]|nr:iron-sulfur cluster assembly scaffold protein [Fimbriimonadaceae bacterium]